MVLFDGGQLADIDTRALPLVAKPTLPNLSRPPVLCSVPICLLRRENQLLPTWKLTIFQQRTKRIGCERQTQVGGLLEVRCLLSPSSLALTLISVRDVRSRFVEHMDLIVNLNSLVRFRREQVCRSARQLVGELRRLQLIHEF